MSDDIVDRLRIIWTSCSDRINKEREEAADEIERLRAERDGKEIDIVQMASICSPVAFKMALRELDGFDSKDTAIRITAARAVELAREIVRQSRREASR